MSTVTAVAKSCKQPKGGYLNPADLDVFEILDDDEGELSTDVENIRPNLVGMAVDYLTRFAMGAPPDKAFRISLQGARIANDYDYAKKLLKLITGINKPSVSAACKLVGYDVCVRFGLSGFKPVSDIEPDIQTTNHIITMVKRCTDFCRSIGPIVMDGFTFLGGYTPIVSAGDGDYLTKDVLLDIKVLKDEPRTAHTLQLLMYYIMGCNSVHEEFKSVKYLVIFNPRKNKYYSYPIERIPPETIEAVSRDVIGYDSDHEKRLDSLKKSWAFLNGKTSSLARSTSVQKKKNTNLADCYNSTGKASHFNTGDRVYHQQFGKGVVLNTIEVGNKSFVDVQFGSDIGKKKIISDFLDKIDS